jgi:hypothetical protein
MPTSFGFALQRQHGADSVAQEQKKRKCREDLQAGHCQSFIFGRNRTEETKERQGRTSCRELFDMVRLKKKGRKAPVGLKKSQENTRNKAETSGKAFVEERQGLQESVWSRRRQVKPKKRLW